MDEPAAKRRRGMPLVFAAAFVLLLVSGACFGIASLDRLESLSLLRVSSWLSGTAIVVAVAAVVLPGRR